MLSSCLRYNIAYLLYWLTCRAREVEKHLPLVIQQLSCGDLLSAYSWIVCTDLRMKLSPIYSLSPMGGKIPYKINTHIYIYELLKWLLTAGRKVHVCWLVVAVKDVFWNVTANRQDGTAACLRVGRYDSLHFPVFHPSISVFPLKTKPVISCRNVVEDLYCVEWSCIINVSLGQLYNEEEDHVLGVFCMFDLVFLLHRSLLLL